MPGRQFEKVSAKRVGENLAALADRRAASAEKADRKYQVGEKVRIKKTKQEALVQEVKWGMYVLEGHPNQYFSSKDLEPA